MGALELIFYIFFYIYPGPPVAGQDNYIIDISHSVGLTYFTCIRQSAARVFTAHLLITLHYITLHYITSVFVWGRVYL